MRESDESKDSEERNRLFSEEAKKVIPSEEIEEIEQDIAESLEEVNYTGFHSSIVSIIDHMPNYLVQKPTSD